MAGRPNGASRKPNQKRKVQFKITCSDMTEKAEEAPMYTLEVPSLSTQINYHGEMIDIHVQQLETLYILGRGGFANVVAVALQGRPEIKMAVKEITLETKDEQRRSTYTDLTTIQNVGSQNYPYVIAYYGAVINRADGELLICVELMDASMERFYRAMHRSKSTTHDELDRLLCRLTHNITSALHFLKTNRILHRDVKPHNMLVNRQAVFKLCDFGISRVMSMSRSVLTGSIQGTEAYLAPELITNSTGMYGIRADMWALGLSLFEMVDGKNPFAGLRWIKAMEIIPKWTPTFPDEPEVSDDVQQLIRTLLKSNLEERPRTYPDILETPSIRDVAQMPSDAEKDFVVRIIQRIPRFGEEPNERTSQ